MAVLIILFGSPSGVLLFEYDICLQKYIGEYVFVAFLTPQKHNSQNFIRIVFETMKYFFVLNKKLIKNWRTSKLIQKDQTMCEGGQECNWGFVGVLFIL